jgi:hypothetical protein
MAKKGDRSFATKVAKSTVDTRKHCPVCGEVIEYIKQITTVTNTENNSMRFPEKMIAVCKCNRNEVYK